LSGLTAPLYTLLASSAVAIEKLFRRISRQPVTFGGRALSELVTAPKR
jgi:hypothetical protein